MLQGLTEAAGAPVRISFTPTLMPMSRGMQSTCYVRLAKGASPDDLREHLQVGAAALAPQSAALQKMGVTLDTNTLLTNLFMIAGCCRSGTRGRPLCTCCPRAASPTRAMCGGPTTTSSQSSPTASRGGPSSSLVRFLWMPAHFMLCSPWPHTATASQSEHMCKAAHGVVLAVIDNLVKGASGQAMQNLNLIMGIPEETGLMQLAMFP